MDALRTLEEKIVSLVAVIHELKAKNEVLVADNNRAHTESQELRAAHDLLLQENAQLIAKLNTVESSMLKGNERMEETKLVVDDLIRSIDALVSSSGTAYGPASYDQHEVDAQAPVPSGAFEVGTVHLADESGHQ